MSPSPPRRSRPLSRSLPRRSRSLSRSSHESPAPSPSSPGQRRSRSRSSIRHREQFLSVAASPMEEDAENRKLLFFYFMYSHGPMHHALYAIDMPNPIPFPPNNPQDELKNAKDIYPIMEFPAYEYPAGQCCVELDNKLYFLGGQLFCEWRDENHCLNSKVSDACYPDSVYTLDISSITADTFCNHPSQLLKPAPPMASGKPQCYAFAAYGKIYALAGSSFVIRGSTSRFEEFDPVKNEWKCLPIPSSTWRVCMIGHAVVGRKVFLSSLSSDIYAYDLDTGLWSQLANHRALAYNFSSTAVFVDDVLYAWMYRTPVAFSKAKTKSESNMEEDENEDFQLFDQRIFISSEMEAKLRARLPVIHPSVALAHLGDNMLCLVRTGSPVAVEPEPGTRIDPSMLEDDERRNISIHGHRTKYYCKPKQQLAPSRPRPRVPQRLQYQMVYKVPMSPVLWMLNPLLWIVPEIKELPKPPDDNFRLRTPPYEPSYPRAKTTSTSATSIKLEDERKQSKSMLTTEE
ncbi:hypothetical protein RJ640_014956 [Escallonia rubra]|uniref:Uncharacterized protein n=1 Tax=Escallonia rubra TaxID=112253 RepID=A0AA88S0P1_9ASTE|nr:hypothetical protein RJ640_014956 [Escallonia rubra]